MTITMPVQDKQQLIKGRQLLFWIIIRRANDTGKQYRPKHKHQYHNGDDNGGTHTHSHRLIAFMLVTATLLLPLPLVEAAVSPALDVGQAQTYCGLSQGSYPTSI
eukprot:PhM_4_TR17472/c0_g3_i1/m.33058